MEQNTRESAEETKARLLTMLHKTGDRRSIERALGALEYGTYGVCTDCARHIAPKRLAACPDAERCLACQEAAEQLASQPCPPRQAVFA